MFMIPPNMLTSVQFDTCIANNTREEKTLKDIRALLQGSWKQGQTPISQLVDAMVETSVTELKAKVKYWDEKAQELKSQSHDAEKQDQMDLIKAKEQFKAEFEQDAKEQQAKTNELLVQIQQQRIALDGQIAQRNSEIQQKANEDTNKLKLLDLINKEKAETGVLAENKEARIVNQELDKIRIQLDAMMDGMNLHMQKYQTDLGHHETMHGNILQHDAKVKKIDADKKIREKEYLPHTT